MKKVTYDTDELISYRAANTDRAQRELAAATQRLALRRQRDSLPVKIETRRLVLRPPMRGDVPDLVRLADNKAIAERLARLPHPYTRADGVGFVEIIALRDDERPYAITLDGHFIGVVGFSFKPDHAPELGFWLGEPHWGKGLMTEAAKGLVDAAHATGHFELIAARALADNAASLRVQEKLGFQRVGEGTETFAHRGEQPVVYLELRRPRWM